ncbi:hypothetical protein HCH_06954 [Hahella chejuensis KCTC 2396]|uniref:Uncharacterized protein n=1 Tax=Hahella chejuensis (strain KCTC 2396) TaxID=349521 RepID=Q2S704_HAHCH|nr:hypothetical protein HCH_06954 [Hahella chejuensis KCTC 2396]
MSHHNKKGMIYEHGSGEARRLSGFEESRQRFFYHRHDIRTGVRRRPSLFLWRWPDFSQME